MKKKKNELTFLNYLIKDGERVNKWWKNKGKKQFIEKFIDPAIYYAILTLFCLWGIVGIALLSSVLTLPCAIEFGGYDKNNLFLIVFLMLWVVATYLYARYCAYLNEVEKQQKEINKHNAEFNLFEQGDLLTSDYISTATQEHHDAL